MVQGLADYAQNSRIIQAWQHPTLRLLYSKQLDGARLLAILNCSHALIVRASVRILCR